MATRFAIYDYDQQEFVTTTTYGTEKAAQDDIDPRLGNCLVVEFDDGLPADEDEDEADDDNE